MEDEEFRMAVVIDWVQYKKQNISRSVTSKMASNIRLLLLKNDISLVSLACSTLL
jgi:hypothetical protein